MFLGAYWSARQETEGEAVGRVSSFLAWLVRLDPELATWYGLGRNRKDALRQPLTSFDRASVLPRMRRNRSDSDGSVIERLGWSLSLWNGAEVSLSCCVGLYAPRLMNSVVVSFGPRAKSPTDEQQKATLEAMIQLFDPDHAVATSHRILDAAGAERPWEAGSLIYQRGGDLRSYPVEL